MISAVNGWNRQKKLFPDLILVEGDLQEEICKHTGKGVDVCIIAATAPTAQTQSLQYMNMNGQLLFFGGLPKDRENVSLNTILCIIKQLKHLWLYQTKCYGLSTLQQIGK